MLPTPPIDPGDETLLAAVRAGDAAALDLLIEKAQGIARRYGRAVCGGAPDSEDAVQEALLRTFRHAGRIREAHAFRAWLYRTVKNACLIGRRRRAGAPAHLASLQDLTVSSEPPADGPDAVDLVSSVESRETIRRALASLAPAHREVVFLRDLEGLSTREVARVLGLSEANVKVRLHRAHQHLRQRLHADAATSSPGVSTAPSRSRRSL